MTASKRTKQLLATGLKELAATTPLRKIRVGELCARCGVDRRTFYYHFRDIYDLAAWIFDQTVDDHIPFEKDHSYERGVGMGLTQIWKDEVFFRCALAEDSQNALGRYMLKHMIAKSECIFFQILDLAHQDIIVFLVVCSFVKRDQAMSHGTGVHCPDLGQSQIDQLVHPVL